MPGHPNYNNSSSSSKHKSDSKQDRQQRNQRPITPFHHRAIMTEDLIAIEHEMANQRLAAATSSATPVPMGPSSSSSQPDMKLSSGANAKFTQPSPAFRPVSTADSSLTESPPSVAPSPLVPPPTSTTNPNETQMPTLSPYPRTGSDSGTPTTSNAPTVLSRTEVAMNALDGHDGNAHMDVHKLAGEHGGIAHNMDGKEEEEDLLWQCFKLPLGHHVDYKRPLLPHQNCEGEELDENSLDALYDGDNSNE